MKRIMLYLFLLFVITGNVRSQEIRVIDFDQLEPLLALENDTIYMVNFWATWCTPCVQEMPDIVKFADEMEGRKFRLLLVSLDNPDHLTSKVVPFAEKFGIVDKVILLDDPDANSWIPKVHPDWMGGIPATLFFSKEYRKFYGSTLDYSALMAEVAPKIMD